LKGEPSQLLTGNLSFQPARLLDFEIWNFDRLLVFGFWFLEFALGTAPRLD